MRTWIAAVLVAALGVHFYALTFSVTGDLAAFIIPWYRYFLAEGFGAVGNYSPPYLYLIYGLTWFDEFLPIVGLVKLLGIAGVGWLAYACCRLLKAINRPWELGLLAFALPSVIADISLLGQADPFWLAPCVLCVAAAVEKRCVAVAAWAGLAFAIKAQAVFIAPFVAWFLYTRMAGPTAWLAAPVAFMAALAPAALSGWPITDLLMIYPNQAAWQPPDRIFVSNGASWWTYFQFFDRELGRSISWLGLLSAGVGVAIYWRLLPPRSNLVLAAFLSAAGLPFLLPGMHERFYMLADVLAFVFAAAHPGRQSITLAVLAQIASVWPMLCWAFSIYGGYLIAPPLMLAALILACREGQRRDGIAGAGREGVSSDPNRRKLAIHRAGCASDIVRAND